MSVTPDPVTAAVPDANPQDAANHIVADADAHTPPTDHVAPPHETTDATNGDNGLSELKDVVTRLAETVNTLVSTVTSRTTPEETPDKLPVLLRGKHVPGGLADD